jgi:hypothetical protein
MMIAQYEHVEFAASGAAMGMVAAVVGGLVIVVLLVWAVRLGVSVRQPEAAQPGPDEQPRLPETGAVREARQRREPEEVVRAADGGERLRPRNLHHSASKPSENQQRPRWGEGFGGA